MATRSKRSGNPFRGAHDFPRSKIKFFPRSGPGIPSPLFLAPRRFKSRFNRFRSRRKRQATCNRTALHAKLPFRLSPTTEDQLQKFRMRKVYTQINSFPDSVYLRTVKFNNAMTRSVNYGAGGNFDIRRGVRGKPGAFIRKRKSMLIKGARIKLFSIKGIKSRSNKTGSKYNEVTKLPETFRRKFRRRYENRSCLERKCFKTSNFFPYLLNATNDVCVQKSRRLKTDV